LQLQHVDGKEEEKNIFQPSGEENEKTEDDGL
jgi:hypothetical protein